MKEVVVVGFQGGRFPERPAPAMLARGYVTARVAVTREGRRTLRIEGAPLQVALALKELSEFAKEWGAELIILNRKG